MSPEWENFQLAIGFFLITLWRSFLVGWKRLWPEGDAGDVQVLVDSTGRVDISSQLTAIETYSIRPEYEEMLIPYPETR